MYRIDYTCYFARLVQGLTDINVYGSLTYFTCIFTSLYKSSLLGGEKGEINDLVSQDSLWVVIAVRVTSASDIQFSIKFD